MSTRHPDLDLLRRRIRRVCLVIVPLVACAMTALALWNDARAGRPFEPHPIFSGLGMVGWGFAVFVLSGPVLTLVARLRERRNGR
ncbi:hypothetical protein HT136_16450 [Novosphingobium profundi]|uniref:hypothetical protein n=1 Tax=Novosphingobium profundi TaxID=1774954 RepID=UPI001BD91290|nr:hypothetical protein [Novosphingobium profundi]MBT0669958.1 hypothetical protein [Novosphingobium profundi]